MIIKFKKIQTPRKALRNEAQRLVCLTVENNAHVGVKIDSIFKPLTEY